MTSTLETRDATNLPPSLLPAVQLPELFRLLVLHRVCDAGHASTPAGRPARLRVLYQPPSFRGSQGQVEEYVLFRRY